MPKFKIDDYAFGRIVINGKEYTHDVVITPSKIIDNWWRKEGHRVYLEDLTKYGVFNEDFEYIVFGTGYHGFVRVEDEVIKELERRGIKYYIAPTKEAVKKFNELSEKGVKVVGAFHLTC